MHNIDPPTARIPAFKPSSDATSSYHDISGAYGWSRYMNPPAPIQHTQTQPYHGIKRSAPDDEIEASSNISTEFKKLRLNHVRPASVVPVRSSVSSHNRSHDESRSVPSDPRTSLTSLSQPYKSTHNDSSQSVDSMTIDDTPNRVYISDLDREIAEIEAAESLHDVANGSFFLPDIDKNISKIPLNVLRQNFDAGGAVPASDRSANEQALVLYRDPASISVPEEEDVVRKAIIAARKEAREKMKQDHECQLNADHVASVGTTDRNNLQATDIDDDGDLMDME